MFVTGVVGELCGCNQQQEVRPETAATGSIKVASAAADADHGMRDHRQFWKLGRELERSNEIR